jgi:AraC-like DNA-binding protein
VLAERFRRYLSETPIAYLTRWRLQLGAQMLRSTSSSVAQIAVEVGYESEPAFNRAFKREFGLPPARFRTESKLAASKAAAKPAANNRGVQKHATKSAIKRRTAAQRPASASY